MSNKKSKRGKKVRLRYVAKPKKKIEKDINEFLGACYKMVLSQSQHLKSIMGEQEGSPAGR